MAAPLSSTAFRSARRATTTASAETCRSGRAVASSPRAKCALMNPDVGDSLDGRYFGPFPASAVIGHAIPLFTDEDGEGRFVWRAPMR